MGVCDAEGELVPLYDRRCMHCGRQINDLYELMSETSPVHCPECNGPMLRVMASIATINADLNTHHNVSVGKVVHNRREFRDALKAKSDEMSARTGITHSFEEVDRRDTSALGVTQEGLDSTARVHHNEGRTVRMPE